jgi:hypothetical protein
VVCIPGKGNHSTQHRPKFLLDTKRDLVETGCLVGLGLHDRSFTFCERQPWELDPQRHLLASILAWSAANSCNRPWFYSSTVLVHWLRRHRKERVEEEVRLLSVIRHLCVPHLRHRYTLTRAASLRVYTGFPNVIATVQELRPVLSFALLDVVHVHTLNQFDTGGGFCNVLAPSSDFYRSISCYARRKP